MDILLRLPPKICYFLENTSDEIFGPSLTIHVCHYFEDLNEWLLEFYEYAMSISDPRVMDWPLMSSGFPIAFILFVYLIFAVNGPKLMKNREPFDLRWLIIVYNLALSVVNFYMASMMLYLTTKLRYSYVCMPIVYGQAPSTDPDELEVVKIYYLCFLTKLIDFMDTVFFVLRKKSDQLSFLHIYHHLSMSSFWWGLCHWFSTGGPTFQGLIINSYIHFFMYMYYGLAAMGPAMQKRLWWKKYLTRLQMIQFSYAVCLAIVQVSVKCPMPTWMLYACMTYMFSLIALFGNFYYHAYRKKNIKQTEKTNSEITHQVEDKKDQVQSSDKEEDEDYVVVSETP